MVKQATMVNQDTIVEQYSIMEHDSEKTLEEMKDPDDETITYWNRNPVKVKQATSPQTY
jgi:hypothetical protein